MILMCVSTELSLDNVLVTIDDLVIVPTPVFVTEIVPRGNVSNDVNLEHKIKYMSAADDLCMNSDLQTKGLYILIVGLTSVL